MPAKSRITDQKKEELFEALRKALPVTIACDLIGIPRQTVYDWMKKNDAFRTQVNICKAEAIRGLVAMTGKQGGAWKLLKNLGKEEFKEHVDITSEQRVMFEVDAGDEEDADEFPGY